MSPQSSFHGHGEAEPLGLEYICAVLVDSGFQVEIVSDNEARVAGERGNPGISLLSAITAEYDDVKARAVAAKGQGYVTVLGGYHASGLPDEVVNGPFDYVVVGEGEHACLALARTLLRGEPFEMPGGYVIAGPIPRLIRAPRIDDLDALPLPLRRKDFIARNRLLDLMWPPPSKQTGVALVLASRGCVHNCDFCASAAVWGRGVRRRSIPKVVEEVQELKGRYDANTAIFIDQSFGQLTDWTLGLCRALRDSQLGVNWYHQSNLDVSRDVIRAMAEAGCTKIGFGLEGLSPRAIETIKPGNPTSIEKLNGLFEYCNSLGLFVKLYTMIGFPWETDDVIREYAEWVPRLAANQIKISYFTPFPGTADWSRYSAQLVSRDWADFDTVRMPVVRNPSITVAGYHEIRRRLFRVFYGSPVFAETASAMTRMRPHYAQSYREFGGFLLEHDMIDGNEKWLGEL